MDPDTRRTKFGAGQSGQGFVEFALILPVLLLLAWGIIEFGRMLFIYTEVSNAAREAVRYGVARGTDPYADPNYLDCQGIRDAGKGNTTLTPLEDGDFQIAYDHGGGALIGTCDNPPGDVQLGDRLLITVTHPVAPLILFQDAGPFNVQFHTARTIVHQGIPMDDGGGAGPPPAYSPVLTVTYALEGCEAQFFWTYDGGDATSFSLYRSFPLPPDLIEDEITGNSFPADGPTHPVANDEVYYVRPFNDAGGGSRSNTVTISGCSGLLVPPNFQFTRTDYFPCSGHLSWDDAGDDAVGYRIYRDGWLLLGEVSEYRFPEVGELGDVADGQVYQVVGVSDAEQEGPPASLTIDSCTPPPLEPPTGLTFVPNQTYLPCNGYFFWDDVGGAQAYRIYQNDFAIRDGLTIPRYPQVVNTYVPVANGDWYNVTAYNPGEETGFSDTVTISGCWESYSGPVTLFLHSNPTPPVWHANAPPPLVMDPVEPAHDNLYNYNGTDPAKPGREITKNGGTPPGETDPDKYVEWRGGPYAQTVTLQSDVTLIIYGKNPLNQDVTTYFYLYDLHEGYYDLKGSATHVWPKQSVNWKDATLTLGGAGYQIQPGHQLVVWVTSDGLKNIQFAYDTKTYESRLEFMGEW
jgi:hypothetical protein